MRLSKLLAGLAVASLALAACGTSGGGTANKGTIKIGVDLPESGAEASDGIPTLNGVKYAVQTQTNVEGFTIEVSNLDDAVSGVHDPQKGAQNMQQFVSDSKVLGVVGPFNSNVARAEIPISNRAHLAQISPANTNQCLTKNIYIPTTLGAPKDITCKDAGILAPADLRPTGINNYFRVATTDDLQGPAMADYAVDVLKVTKLGVASDNEAYGKGIADTFTAEFNNKDDFGAYSMPAYDCAKILIAAIQRAIKSNGGNMPTREAVRAEVAKTSGFVGALGSTSFDSNGDTSQKIISIYQAKGSPVDWVWVKQINYAK